MIPFNKPFVTGNELKFIDEVISSSYIASNGKFTKKCERFFEKKYGFERALLTNSCTTALEMAAILINVKPGDEIIVPSYTYVSTANVFVKYGAKIIFADVCEDFPNLDAEKLETLISKNTKAIVPVHYAGVSCNMDRIMQIANRHKLFVIEDAAMSINSKYKSRYVGSIGHFAAFSFHETKNISCGEGGLLVVNDSRFINRAETIRDKGTNRNQFLKGNIKKYEWVDVGGSFAANEITAAYLYAQLEQLEYIQRKRKELWITYKNEFDTFESSFLELQSIPSYAYSNNHTFFVLCNSKMIRNKLIEFMAQKGIQLSFHYQSLHQATYFLEHNQQITLPFSEKYSDQLVRLPLFSDLDIEQVKFICEQVMEFLRVEES